VGPTQFMADKYVVSVEFEFNTIGEALEIASEYEESITYLDITKEEENFIDVDEVDVEDACEEENK
jgi:hypothetical protein